MKIFISWSGSTSRAVAEVFYSWIPKVIQTVEPFISSKDLDKGATWTYELAKELADTNFAIICLAPDNLDSPWLHYEAGAIAKSLDSRPCPVLFQLNKEQVSSPLSQFQLTSIVKEDIELLMKSINASAGNPLTDELLADSINMRWANLEEKIAEIAVPSVTTLKDTKSEPEKPAFDIQDMLEEIITRLRRLENRTRHLGDGLKSNSQSSIPVIPQPSMLNRLVDTINQQAIREGFSISRWEHDIFEDKIIFFVEGSLPDNVSFPFWSAASQLSKEEKVNVIFQASDGALTFQADTYWKG